MRLFKLAAVLIMAALVASCASAPTGTAPAIAAWQTTPAWKAYGLQLAQNVPAVNEGPAEVVITSAKDLQVYAQVNNLANDEVVKDGLTVEGSSPAWRLAVKFPGPGLFRVSVFAKATGAPGNSFDLVAFGTLRSSVDPAASWQTFPAFAAAGMSVAAPPARAAGAETRIHIAGFGDRDLGAVLVEAASGNQVDGALRAEDRDGGLDVVIAFPAPGTYSLRLSSKPKGAPAADWRSIALATFDSTFSAADLGLPENWTPQPGVRSLALTGISVSPRAAGDRAVIQFSSTQAFDMGFSLVDAVTGKALEGSYANVILSERNGGDRRYTIFFPSSGTWDVTMAAKRQGSSTWTGMGTLHFTSTASAAESLPDNWATTIQFRRWNLAISAAPPREAAGDLAVTLAVPEDWQGSARLVDKSTGKDVTSILSEVAGRAQRITAALPHAGDYELTISGTGESKTSPSLVATGIFTSKLDPALASYLLWSPPGAAGWPRFSVLQETVTKKVWEPLGVYSYFQEYRSGTLSQDVTVSVGTVPVTIARGAKVSYGTRWNDPTAVSAILAPPAKDVAVTAYGVKLAFKAGTPLAIDSTRLFGTTAVDVKIAIDGNTLLAPKGSQLLVEGEKLREASLAAKASLTVAGKAYDCAGFVEVDDYGQPGDPVSIRIVPTKDLAFKIGGTSFTLPAGSQLTFLRQRVSRVIFVKDTKVTLPTGVELVAAGWGLEFDEKGTATKVQAE